jgi:hypothetical protein
MATVSQKNEINSSRFYTTLQYQEFTDEDDNSRLPIENNKVFAKAIKSGFSRDINKSGPTHYKFYIRIFPNQKLYDPFPKYSVSDNKNSFVDKVCRSETGYKEVPESIFNMYLNYLRTENSQWLYQAQREVSNSR